MVGGTNNQTSTNSSSSSNSSAPIQNRRANAFSDIFGRPPAPPSSLQSQPSYRSSGTPSIRNSPQLNNNNQNNELNYSQSSNSSNYQSQAYYQQQQQLQQQGQRSTSGGSYRDSEYNNNHNNGGGGQRYQGDLNYSQGGGGYQQQLQPNYDQYGSNNGYRQYSQGQYSSPNSYQGEWPQQQQISDQPRPSFSSSQSSQYHQDEHLQHQDYPSPDLAGRQQAQFNSPQSNYAPTLASGPPSASTSNSQYPVPNSPTSLPYNYQSSHQHYSQDSHALNSSTASSNYSITSSLPPSLPVLPEFLPTDDFYGFESSRLPEGVSSEDPYSSNTLLGKAASIHSGTAIRRDSGGSTFANLNLGNGSNSAIDETDQFDSFGAYPSYRKFSIPAAS